MPPVGVGGRGYTLMGVPRPRVPKPATLSASSTPSSVVIQFATADLVERIDLHRTALARLSSDVGTMGPPIAAIVPAGGAWPVYARYGRSLVAAVLVPRNRLGCTR